jgi:hypothetical protein
VRLTIYELYVLTSYIYELCVCLHFSTKYIPFNLPCTKAHSPSDALSLSLSPLRAQVVEVLSNVGTLQAESDGGQQFSDAHMRTMFAAIDVDESGSVDW